MNSLSNTSQAGARILLGLILTLSTIQGQVEYTSDGIPTPLEEEIRWHLNRGRFDSARENQARQTGYADIVATAGPVAPHQALTLAVRHHSEDMARNNVFQHNTVPGSTYYNAVTQPTPWDRIHAEGYSFCGAGENVAAGYGSAVSAYLGWWKSTGHRQNMFNPGLREIGNGYYYRAGSTFGHYYTMDLCSAGSTQFFTDTAFHDTNTDHCYTQGEGVSGIRIRLRLPTADHPIYDISGSSGSFAIPIQAIPSGTHVEVWIVNNTGAQTQVTVPRDYDNQTNVTLGPGAQTLAGVFTKPTSISNVGFRDLTQPVVPAIPQLSIIRLGTGIELRWQTQTAVDYTPQASPDLVHWTDLVSTALAGTGSELTLRQTITASRQFYRIRIQSH